MTVYEFSLSIIYLNIISYILINFIFFSLIFVFDSRFLNTLNDFKIINVNPFFVFSTILIFLSFAGVPPTIGFLSKSLLFIFLFLKKFFFFFFFISVINIFIIYFYIKNLRFLINKNNSSNFIFNKNYSFLNQNLIFFINFFNFFNLLGLFYFDDLIIFLDNITLLLYFI